MKSGCGYTWEALISNVYYKRGCPKCGGSLSLTNDIIDARLIDRDIKRLDNYINAKTKINFQCLKSDCRYIWKSSPSNILNYRGCPICSFSKNEKLVLKILEENNFDIETHKNIKNIIKNETRLLIVDFYVNNIIIEYNGRQHYQPVRFGHISEKQAKDNFKKQQERDKYLQNICNEQNIKLIWIDGRKYFDLKLKKYLIEELIPFLNKN